MTRIRVTFGGHTTDLNAANDNLFFLMTVVLCFLD
jgi:hypothetical protein